MKADQVRRVLKALGYELVPGRGKGSHAQYRHPGTGRWTTLSSKSNGIVPTGTLKRMISDLGLTTAQFVDLL